ncbi:MAG: leucyl/phenylalanyl-tRNA--protein transferase [Pseudomonadales bacterium]|jgi:leucyl/phenylalanyl-tRNA--protein transferase
MTDIPWLKTGTTDFPAIDSAMDEPNGLLAAGGDLSIERLLAAYSQGIFPWYEDGQPLLWWSPSPRAVICPSEFAPKRSLRKVLRQNKFEVRLDTAFDQVIEACSGPRDYAGGTWITNEMKEAYKALADIGVAHSFEVYLDAELVGGLYGIGLGKLFFGESMFHRVSDASKVAFAYLNRLMAQNECPLIDCQLPNEHLESLGASEISRQELKQYLNDYVDTETPINWALLPSILPPW